jgi:hypothetical protein
VYAQGAPSADGDGAGPEHDSGRWELSGAAKADAEYHEGQQHRNLGRGLAEFEEAIADRSRIVTANPAANAAKKPSPPTPTPAA